MQASPCFLKELLNADAPVDELHGEEQDGLIDPGFNIHQPVAKLSEPVMHTPPNLVANSQMKYATGKLDAKRACSKKAKQPCILGGEELKLWIDLFSDDNECDIDRSMLALEKYFLKREIKSSKY